MKRPLRILITGIPGTGKTTLAKKLAPKLNARIISEKALIQKKGVGKWNPALKEYEVELPALKKEILSTFKKIKHNVILEGHVSCEISLPVDGIILTRCERSTLEKRLKKRKYSPLKMEENLYCEETHYVREALRKHAQRAPILEISTHHPKKGQMSNVMRWINTKIWGKSHEKVPTHSITRRPRIDSPRARTHTR